MRVSIVTISLDASHSIAETIRSVLAQDYSDLEYIILDGGSTDGTQELVQGLVESESRVSFRSDRDEGIADAMNKALEIVSGELVLFLHADDVFYSQSSVTEMVRLVDDSVDLVLADSCYKPDGNCMLRRPHGWNWRILFKTGVIHQSCLMRTARLKLLQGFDTRYRIAMDYELFYRAYQKGMKASYLPLPVSVMGLGGLSTSCHRNLHFQRIFEEFRIHFRNAKPYMYPVYTIYWLMYFPYKSLLLFATGKRY